MLILKLTRLTLIVVTRTANTPQLLYSTLSFKTLLGGKGTSLGGEFAGGKIPWWRGD